MIDIDNYKRAIAWLRRGMAEFEKDRSNRSMRLGLLHSFEVTYNISEAHLRELYALVDDEEGAILVSARELIRCAADHGLVLSTPRQWMYYGLIIEDAREACLTSPTEAFELPLDLLSGFADELDVFANRLERQGAALA